MKDKERSKKGRSYEDVLQTAGDVTAAHEAAAVNSLKEDRDREKTAGDNQWTSTGIGHDPDQSSHKDEYNEEDNQQ